MCVFLSRNLNGTSEILFILLYLFHVLFYFILRAGIMTSYALKPRAAMFSGTCIMLKERKTIIYYTF